MTKEGNSKPLEYSGTLSLNAQYQNQNPLNKKENSPQKIDSNIKNNEVTFPSLHKENIKKYISENFYQFIELTPTVLQNLPFELDNIKNNLEEYDIRNQIQNNSPQCYPELDDPTLKINHCDDRYQGSFQI